MNDIAILIKAKNEASAAFQQVAKDAAVLKGPVAQAGQAVDGLGKNTAAASSQMHGMGGAMGELTKLTVAFGGAMMAIGALEQMAKLAAAPIVVAAAFEKSLSAVQAVSGATRGELQQLSGLAMQLGKDTAFSANEAAQALEELVKGGVSIPDIMNGAAKATVNLAAAGGIDLASAAEIAANALNSFNLKGQDMAHVADVIAGAANASAIDVNDFRLSLAQSAAVAATVGLSFDDLSVAIAQMGQSGIKGSDAGTSLKQMLISLVPISNTARGEMEKLGIITAEGKNQFFDAAGKVKSYADISQVLQNALAGLTEEQKLASLQIIFGSDAIRGAAVAAKNGASGFNEMAGAMGNVTAEGVAGMKLDNLAGDMEQLSGSVETLAITIGTKLTPEMRRATQAGTAWVNWVITSIAQMDAAKKTVEEQTKANADLAKELGVTGVASQQVERVQRQLSLAQQMAAEDAEREGGAMIELGNVLATAADAVKNAKDQQAAWGETAAAVSAEMGNQWGSAVQLTEGLSGTSVATQELSGATAQLLGLMSQSGDAASIYGGNLSTITARIKEQGGATLAQTSAYRDLETVTKRLAATEASRVVGDTNAEMAALRELAATTDDLVGVTAIAADALYRADRGMGAAAEKAKTYAVSLGALGLESKSAAGAQEKLANAIEKAKDKAREAQDEFERDLGKFQDSYQANMIKVGQKVGRDINEATIDAARSIQDAKDTFDRSMRDLDTNRGINADIRSRREALDATLGPQEEAIRKAFDARRRDYQDVARVAEMRYQLERDLSKATTDEERKKTQERYQEAVKDFQRQRDVATDERDAMAKLAAQEADQLAGVNKQRRELEDTLAQEAYDRDVTRLNDARDAAITATNEALGAKKTKIWAAAEEETAKLREEQEKRITDLQEQVIDKLPDLTGKADATVAEFIAGVGTQIGTMAEDAITAAGNIQTAMAGVISGAKAAGDAVANIPRSVSVNVEQVPYSRQLRAYASGGIVAGAIGQPQLAVVHGGETIIPAGGGGGGINEDRLAAKIAAAMGNVRIEMDGQRLARLVTTEQGYIRSIG